MEVKSRRFTINHKKMHTHIGYTKKAKGLDGTIKLKIFDEYWEDLSRVEAVFVDIVGKKIPYFVEHLDVEGMSIRFEDISDRDMATALTGKEIYLQDKDVLADEERTFTPESATNEALIGFTMIDTEQGEIGVIEEIIEMPQQELAVIQYEGREIMIPLHENLVEGVDETTKIIVVNLPLGILDL